MQDIPISKGRIELWKASIQKYKDTIFTMYGKYPSEKLVESHCKLCGIPYPVPRIVEVENEDE